MAHPVLEGAFTWSEKLEARGKALTASLRFITFNPELSSPLERKIALTLDQIDTLRDLHDRSRRRLGTQHLTLGSELANMDPKPQSSLDTLGHERSSLKKDQRNIEDRIIDLDFAFQRDLRNLHNMLLYYINKLEFLQRHGQH